MAVHVDASLNAVQSAVLAAVAPEQQTQGARCQ